MEVVKETMQRLGIKPKLRLGRKLDKEKDGKGGIESLGPKAVKFLEEPIVGKRKNFDGKQVDHYRFLVEHKGVEYYWYVPIFDKEGNPSYLLPALQVLKVGGDYVLEMKSQGGKNHVEIFMSDGVTRVEADEEVAPTDDDDDETEPDDERFRFEGE